MKHVFGPVPSRRLGSSLGIDLVPYKTCSFDCIYCQLGRTTNKTVVRKEYIPLTKAFAEVREVLAKNLAVDYITLSGSGEPLLHSGIGRLIKKLKSITEIPIAVLTSASIIGDSKVREELMHADLLVPSLDAATQKTFERINRPFSGIRINGIIEGLARFREKFKGKIWLEIMLVKGVNDSPEDLAELKKAIKKIKPDKVQLNTVVRPPSEDYAKPLSPERLQVIASILGAEVIAGFKRRDIAAYKGEKEELISGLLKRRPCTIRDISSALGIHENEVLKYIEVLVGEEKVTKERLGRKEYFKIGK